MDDIILNKAAIIERCIHRIQEEYAGDERNLLENLTKQDSIILNLQRACEAAIDLAMHPLEPAEVEDAARAMAAKTGSAGNGLGPGT